MVSNERDDRRIDDSIPATIRIDRRFRGPPESGNGGYVCGRVARFIDGPAVVRLRVPPPLETDLVVRPADGELEVYDDETLVAEARPAALEVVVPEPPGYEEAEEASRDYRGFEQHAFPNCFVCGPERDPDDGLRIFAGPVPGRDLVAAPWIPHGSLEGAEGAVAPEFLWAALDCPGASSFTAPEDRARVLGELAAEIRGGVPVGERCVVIGWERRSQGRRHWTGTALFDESGDCRAVGLGTWFEVESEGTP
ncbi:MAG: hypothetical protein R3223_13525 [Longimicrobiales bacterium]|nr:hypothetical protein [Longimicrobiales bacterium]